MKPISLQLFTLREMAKTDWRGMLKAVSDIGYVGVETAGLYGQTPADLKKVVDDLGLKVMAMHGPFPDPKSIKDIVEAAKAFECKYYVLPGIWGMFYRSAESIRHIGALLEAAADILGEYGVKFGYHNHEHEMVMVEGDWALARLYEAAPSVVAEIDTYWAANFGQVDPVPIVKRFARRAPLLHIKDGVYEQKPRAHVALGAGKMDIPAVIAAADPEVLEWLVVELDNCTTDMLTAVRESYQYLTGKGLAKGRK